jgi:hypothetical protein
VIVAVRIPETQRCKARMFESLHVSEPRHFSVEAPAAEQAPSAVRPRAHEVVRRPSRAAVITSGLRH